MTTPLRRFNTLAIAASNFLIHKTHQWDAVAHSEAFAPYFPAPDFQEVLSRFMDAGKMPGDLPAQPYFVASLYLSMLLPLVLPKGTYPFSLISEKSLSEVYIPFQIDSNQNVERELAFENETQLTRYRCTGCRKLIVWVGECGNLAHTLTIKDYREQKGYEPKCRICKTVIGHEGYNMPVNLERLDPSPIPKAEKDKLKVVDPGYQGEVPTQG